MTATDTRKGREHVSVADEVVSELVLKRIVLAGHHRCHGHEEEKIV